MALYACTNCIRQGCLWETSKRYVHNTASIADHYCTSPIVQITVNDLHEKFSLRSMNWWKTSFADCIMCNKQTVDSALHILFSNTCKQEATNKLKILIYIWWKCNQAISSNGIVSIAPYLPFMPLWQWDGNVEISDNSLFWCHWDQYPKVTLRWFHAYALSKFRCTEAFTLS